jgi:hypothetical protein
MPRRILLRREEWMKRKLAAAAAAMQAAACFAGSFFVNIAVIRADTGKVESAVRDLGLNACIVTDRARPGFSLVCDERADSQDEAYGKSLAKKLSIATRSPVLYTLVHDSDVLILELFRGGTSVFSYDSWPGYFAGEDPSPDIEGLEEAAKAFKVGQEGLKAILESPSAGEYVFADDLLIEILNYLGLPDFIAGCGYEYIRQDQGMYEKTGLTVKKL